MRVGKGSTPVASVCIIVPSALTDKLCIYMTKGVQDHGHALAALVRLGQVTGSMRLRVVRRIALRQAPIALEG